VTAQKMLMYSALNASANLAVFTYFMTSLIVIICVYFRHNAYFKKTMFRNLFMSSASSYKEIRRYKILWLP